MSQWAKINGDWYYFDANGYAELKNESIARVNTIFTTEMAALATTVNTQMTALYTLLYQLMTAWCNSKFAEGIDIPMLTITVDMVDLSKTTEYAGFTDLVNIKLGDSVKCEDYEHDIVYTNRVIGLTYDCIRDFNKAVVIGTAAQTVAQILGNASGQANASGFDTTAIDNQLQAQNTAIGALQSGKQDKLTAGDNITIVNNRISAKGGLSYWHETQTRLYQNGTHEDFGSDANYQKTQSYEIGHMQSGNGWFRLMVTRISTSDAPIVVGYTNNAHPMIVVASRGTLDNFQWGWSDYELQKPYRVPTWADKDTYPLYTGGYSNYFGYAIGTTTYNNETWNVLLIDCYTWAGGTIVKDIPVFTFNEYSAENPNVSGAGLALLQQAHAYTLSYDTTTELGTENYMFRYGANNKDFAFVDDFGNGKFTEISTNKGSLSSQLLAKNKTYYGMSAPTTPSGSSSDISSTSC